MGIGTYVVHAKEFGHSEDNSSVPGENGKGCEDEEKEECWEEEDGEFGIALWDQRSARWATYVATG